MASSAEDRRIRALRPPKNRIDAFTPLGVTAEVERTSEGGREDVVTVFLAGAECPFTCSFCDLWRNTLDGPTPRGALPAQLATALARWGGAPGPTTRIKLYNAGNFFDPRAVPPADLPAIAEQVHGFGGVTVESHPRLLGRRCRDFARRVAGRLEVAMGLETIHPEALSHLNKQCDPVRFEQAAGELAEVGVDLRAFVLLGPPEIPAPEAVEWAVRSVRFAARCGARVVSIIPVRAGNGELDRLAAAGRFVPPTLARLDAALSTALADDGPAVVLADLWDADRLAGCAECSAERLSRLARMNASGRPEPPLACPACA